MLFVPGCGNCQPCAEGRPVLCEPAGQAGVAGTLLSGARRLSRNGQPISHFVGVSAFAEHAVLSRRGVHRIDKSVPLELAALFGCAVMTGVGAVANTARSEEHTSELQSQSNLVCRLLLEKKKKKQDTIRHSTI